MLHDISKCTYCEALDPKIVLMYSNSTSIAQCSKARSFMHSKTVMSSQCIEGLPRGEVWCHMYRTAHMKLNIETYRDWSFISIIVIFLSKHTGMLGK